MKPIPTVGEIKDKLEDECRELTSDFIDIILSCMKECVENSGSCQFSYESGIPPSRSC